MSIEYREALASDAASLIDYLARVGGETDYLSFDKDSFNISEEREARFIEKFRNNKNNLMLVALEGDRVVANASIERNRIKRYSHRAELSITVLREYWGRGIGKSLVEMLLKFAKDSGVDLVYLDVRADNARAISLYKRFGFKSIGVFPKYFKINGEFFDAEIMAFEF